MKQQNRVIEEKNGLAVRWNEYVYDLHGKCIRKTRYLFLGPISREEAEIEGLRRSQSARARTRPTGRRTFNVPFSYPTIPAPQPFVGQGGIPTISGVYFIWKDAVVVYVGQSINLRRRLPQSRMYGEQISWIEFPRSELLWAEAFYIGICRPARNTAGVL
jgi:hypothetical protein